MELWSFVLCGAEYDALPSIDFDFLPISVCYV
jgi:hypothetical protein